ncbi:hypothetical protein BCE_2093 [Bacillus cereus ATCC 10987]|uniref:Uncharacterized protein n=1 Tax=Bacillus cereus (strain ATCC 10987 / NRS 248) TaxID=222523 RepID=Q739P7_BACC1|nr:hypothetical protein BCE_2093 [Bacillus cereus ATCC 10987]
MFQFIFRNFTLFFSSFEKAKHRIASFLLYYSIKEN